MPLDEQINLYSQNFEKYNDEKYIKKNQSIMINPLQLNKMYDSFKKDFWIRQINEDEEPYNIFIDSWNQWQQNIYGEQQDEILWSSLQKQRIQGLWTIEQQQN